MTSGLNDVTFSMLSWKLAGAQIFLDKFGFGRGELLC